MTWGDWLNQIAKLHEEFFSRFPLPVDPNKFEHPELEISIFPFPKSIGINEEFEWVGEYEDPLVLFHPVYRFLLEGPLSPKDLIDLNSTEQRNRLIRAITRLEIEWLAKLVRENEGLDNLFQPGQAFITERLEETLNELS